MPTMDRLSGKLFQIFRHPDFLLMRGQANEVPIFIQTYDPAAEDEMRRVVDGLAGRLRSSGIVSKALDLFDLVLEELEECEILKGLLEDEATFEKVELLETLQNYSDPKTHLIPRLIRAIGDDGTQLILPWQKVRDSVDVKLYQHEGELYVLAKSGGRQAKEIAMRRKRLVRLVGKLRVMRKSLPKRDQLLLRIGAAKKEAGRAYGFVTIQIPQKDEAVTRETFSFQIDKAKLKAAEQRDGHYLLRSNLTGEDPAVLWTRYVQLTQIESVFRSLKSELGIRPIYHQLEHRADAHVLIAFLAYCLQVTLKNRLMIHAPGLTPAAVFEKLATIQMVEVWIPMLDGRWLVLPRHTQPEKDVQAVLNQCQITLPCQPPPRIKASQLADPGQKQAAG